MAEIILHQFERSPFSEKVRAALGIKNAAWRAVEIPRMMPKPDLMPLTGGYRKTPVMQIGADIYCDTRLIIREIDRRIPDPPLYPAGGAELAAAWMDGPLFTISVGVVFGSLADKLPPEFKEERARFTAGLFDAERMKAAQPTIRAQWRAYLSMLESGLADGRPYLFGDMPSIADLASYHLVWFIGLNLPDSGLLAGAPKVEAWSGRIARFGHGKKTSLDAKEALAVAKSATPAPVKSGAPNADASGCRPGQRVTVAANDYGRDPVLGELIAIDDDAVVIRRGTPDLGDLHVHFPRTGFDVSPA